MSINSLQVYEASSTRTKFANGTIQCIIIQPELDFKHYRLVALKIDIFEILSYCLKFYLLGESTTMATMEIFIFIFLKFFNSSTI